MGLLSSTVILQAYIYYVAEQANAIGDIIFGTTF